MKSKAFLLVLSAAAVAFTLGSPALAQKIKLPTNAQQGQTANGIAAERPQTARALQTLFPDEFAEVNAGFSDIYGSDDEAGEKQLATSKILDTYRARYIQQVRNAPDELLKPVIQALADLHVAIAAGEEPSTCGEFTLNGTSDLFNRQLAGPYIKQLDTMSAAYLRAVAGGIAQPTSTEAAKPEDWNAIAQLVIAEGAPQSHLDAIVAADPSNPEICQGMITLLQAMVNMPGEAGHRLRAELAVSASLY